MNGSIIVHDLLKEYSSDDFRMFCLLNHYSARVQLDDNGLLEAKQQWRVLKDVSFFALFQSLKVL